MAGFWHGFSSPFWAWDRVIRIFGSMLVRPLKTRMRLNRRLPRLGGTGIGIGTDIYMHVSSDDVERIVFRSEATEHAGRRV